MRDVGFYSSQGIELLTGRTVVSLDSSRKAARLDDGKELIFDMALLATGGSPRRLPIPGADAPGCLILRTADDARGVLDAASRAKSVTILGAGFIGTELAGACGIGAWPSPSPRRRSFRLPPSWDPVSQGT